MKATITAYGANYVTLAYDDQDGERVLREFSAPSAGGYVEEILANGCYRQVCRKLARDGSTLYFHADKPLIDLIRTEYRAAKRSA